jgi:hypothetical protein
MLPINLVGVIIAAVVAFILGFLFHGPLLGKLWMKLADIHPTGNESFKGMVPQMIWNLIVNLVTAYVLAVVYLFASTSAYGTTGVWGGIICGLWVWIGFLVTTTSIEVIWMKRSVKLWLFECGCSLIVMIVMGAIVAIW